MKDPIIKLKLFAALCLILAPTFIVWITGDNSMIKTYGYVLLVPVMFYNEPGFRGFLKIWFQFHFQHKYKKGLSVGEHKAFQQRIKWLEEGDMAYYEQRLIKDILEYNGVTKIKRKLTGKHHNKMRVKGNIKRIIGGKKVKIFSNYK